MIKIFRVLFIPFFVFTSLLASDYPLQPLKDFVLEGNNPTLKLHRASIDDKPLTYEKGFKNTCEIFAIKLDRFDPQKPLPSLALSEFKSLTRMLTQGKRFGHNGYIPPASLTTACTDFLEAIYDPALYDNEKIEAQNDTRFFPQHLHLPIQIGGYLLQCGLALGLYTMDLQKPNTLPIYYTTSIGVAITLLNGAQKYTVFNPKFFVTSLNFLIQYHKWRGHDKKVEELRENQTTYAQAVIDTSPTFFQTCSSLFSAIVLKCGACIPHFNLEGFFESLRLGTKNLQFFTKEWFLTGLAIDGANLAYSWAKQRQKYATILAKKQKLSHEFKVLLVFLNTREKAMCRTYTALQENIKKSGSIKKDLYPNQWSKEEKKACALTQLETQALSLYMYEKEEKNALFASNNKKEKIALLPPYLKGKDDHRTPFPHPLPLYKKIPFLFYYAIILFLGFLISRLV